MLFTLNIKVLQFPKTYHHYWAKFNSSARSQFLRFLATFLARPWLSLHFGEMNVQPQAPRTNESDAELSSTASGMWLNSAGRLNKDWERARRGQKVGVAGEDQINCPECWVGGTRCRRPCCCFLLICSVRHVFASQWLHISGIFKWFHEGNIGGHGMLEGSRVLFSHGDTKEKKSCVQRLTGPEHFPLTWWLDWLDLSTSRWHDGFVFRGVIIIPNWWCHHHEPRLIIVLTNKMSWHWTCVLSYYTYY